MLFVYIPDAWIFVTFTAYPTVVVCDTAGAEYDANNKNQYTTT